MSNPKKFSTGDKADMLNTGVKTGVGYNKYQSFLNYNRSSNYTKRMPLTDLTQPRGMFFNRARNYSLAAKDLGKFSTFLGGVSGVSSFKSQWDSSQATTKTGKFFSSAFAGFTAFKMNPYVAMLDLATDKRLSNTANSVFDRGVVGVEKTFKRMNSMKISEERMEQMMHKSSGWF